MPRLPLVLLLRMSLLVAIAASAALVVEYANAGNPAFCGVGSGCLAVRLSPYSMLFGVVPLPAIGLAAYGCLFAASLVVRTRPRRMLFAGAAVSGGLAALVLLGLQAFVIKTPDGRPAICAWCVTVDIAAMIAAVAAGLLARPEPGRASQAEDARPFAILGATRISAAWVFAAVAAVTAPFLWGKYPSYPPVSAQLAGIEEPGKLAIVGFTDFECPFCRRLHPVVRDLKAAHPGRLIFSRRMVPLPSHKGAEPAARVYLCTPKDQQDAVADALYDAPEEQLTREGTLAIGKRLGLDPAVLAGCVDAPSTTEQLDEDKALFAALGGLGLPLSYVGHVPVAGFQPDKLRSTVEIELGGGRMSLPLWSMFALLGVLCAGAIVITWKHARPEPGGFAGTAESTANLP